MMKLASVPGSQISKASEPKHHNQAKKIVCGVLLVCPNDLKYLKHWVKAKKAHGGYQPNHRVA